jgi:hypothetical protein
VWSPQGHELPPEPKGQAWIGSAKKLVAMLWKKEYLDGKEGDKQLKTFFRQLQVEGEADIEQNPNQQITPWSRRLLSPGIPLKWRKQREINVLRLIDRFPASTRFSSLFTSWPTGSSPFNFIVLAASSAERDSLRSYLINHMIFTPIHWSLPDNSRSEDLELSRRLLTIPVDFRCSISEVDRIADVINAYVAQS